MSTPASLIEELEHTLASGTNEQRIQALARITDLFVASASRYSEDQIGLFDDVILRIAARIEAKTLAKLSNRLAPIPHAPAKVMKQLAFHDDIAVARPVLSQSERLDELSVVDDDFAWRLSAVENDMVDAYVRGDLSGETLDRFRSFYLSTPKRRGRVEFAPGVAGVYR